jgi:hypothetical protein
LLLDESIFGLVIVCSIIFEIPMFSNSKRVVDKIGLENMQVLAVALRGLQSKSTQYNLYLIILFPLLIIE